METFNQRLGVAPPGCRTTESAVGPGYRTGVHNLQQLPVDGESLGQVGQRDVGQVLYVCGATQRLILLLLLSGSIGLRWRGFDAAGGRHDGRQGHEGIAGWISFCHALSSWIFDAVWASAALEANGGGITRSVRRISRSS